MRFANMVNSANLRPAGMPPSAILIIDKIVGKISNSIRGAGFTTDLGMHSRVHDQVHWHSGVDQQLESAYAQATRPIKGQISESAKSIVFCDQTELVACLCHDIIAGSAQHKWWWQKTYAKNLLANPKSAALAACLLRDTKLIPGVINLLAHWDLAIALVHSLTDAAATRLLNALVVEFSCARLGEEFAGTNNPSLASNAFMASAPGAQDPIAGCAPLSPGPVQQKAQTRKIARGADSFKYVMPEVSQANSAHTLPPWLSLFGDQIWDQRLTKTQLCLLGIARMAHSNLSLLRNAVFEYQILGWWRSEHGLNANSSELERGYKTIHSMDSADVYVKDSAPRTDFQSSPKPLLQPLPARALADSLNQVSGTCLDDPFNLFQASRQTNEKESVDNNERPVGPPLHIHARNRLQPFNLFVEKPEHQHQHQHQLAALMTDVNTQPEFMGDRPSADNENANPIAALKTVNATRTSDHAFIPMETGHFDPAAIHQQPVDGDQFDDIAAHNYWLVDGDKTKGASEGWFETQLGGGLYLLNLFYQLELPECFNGVWDLDQHLSPWALLEVLTRGLLADGHRWYQDDPYWILMARLDRRRKKTVIGNTLSQSIDFYLPVDWWNYLRARPASAARAPVKSTRLYWAINESVIRIWSRKCVVVERCLTLAEKDQLSQATTGDARLQALQRKLINLSLQRYRTATMSFELIHSAFEQAPVEVLTPYFEKTYFEKTLAPGLRRWVALLLPFLRHYLKDRLMLKNTNANLLVKKLLAVPGRIYFTSTHIDLVASIGQTSLRLRCSGLDQDPGWLPVYGHVVLFHFLQD